LGCVEKDSGLGLVGLKKDFDFGNNFIIL